MAEVKVLFVGPKEAGKTALANFLSDAVQVRDGMGRGLGWVCSIP